MIFIPTIYVDVRSKCYLEDIVSVLQIQEWQLVHCAGAHTPKIEKYKKVTQTITASQVHILPRQTQITTKTNKKKGQTLTKLHQQRQAMIYCAGAHTSKKKDKRQTQIQTTTNAKPNKDKLRRCTLLPKQKIDKKTNTNTNDDKYKTKQRQIAQVHILPRENQQQSHEQAVNMAASAAKVLIFIES